ncbi:MULTISPECIES: nucleoside triphosphate pyrophosphatase [Bacillus]|uniref:Maf family protein n=1 Tax=Bacillus TaxID=1386 RepID=UPI001CD48F63|nr:MULTISPECIES: Maf family protein [Bacillus]MCA1036397.1 Maf family protein [Bacillus infantis]MDT0161920.1 Maf family protein [Bacillus sp. AG4(2022)]
MQNLILASSSPRRKELLENLQLKFEVSSSDVDETFEPGMLPENVVMELAARKAESVARKNPAAFVIGSDTIVFADGLILGKPDGRRDAYDMLTRLSGRVHSVYTGVSIITPQKSKVKFYEKTDVEFWELTDDEKSAYIESGEPFDKAGSYGIQGLGATLVKRIDGDYFAVVGLPLSRTARELKKAGFTLPF